MEGVSLDGIPLTFRIYANTNMTNGFQLWREVEGNEVVYNYQGNDFCATLYVTAVRTDVFAESDPSNEASFCTDDDEVPDEIEVQLAPSPPTNTGVFVE